MKPRTISFAALAMLVGAILGAGLAEAHDSDSSEPTPPLPAWVNEDGTVDAGELPDMVPMIDCSGVVVAMRPEALDEETDAPWMPPTTGMALAQTPGETGADTSGCLSPPTLEGSDLSNGEVPTDF